MMNKQKINRILFALDTSGSMRGILPRAIAALNENLRTIREECQAQGQDATVSLLTFNSQVEMRFFNRSISALQDLSDRDFRADGTTALFDAVGMGIEQLLDLPVGADEDVSYLLFAITDGQENGSKKYASRGSWAPPQKLLELMRRVQGTDVWTLTFLVPRGDKRPLVENFQIPDGNVMEWEASEVGVKRYAQANSTGIKGFFAARASGQRSVKSFYTNLSEVSIRDVRQLDDVSGRCQILTVDRDDEIRTFCERRVGSFAKGAAFYQLVGGKKTADKVQDYKKILIMERGSSAVYGGDDARHLLGLDAAGTQKVRPGDNGRFDVFFQSTSVNRLVKKGSKVIYMPSAAV